MKYRAGKIALKQQVGAAANDHDRLGQCVPVHGRQVLF